MANRSMPWSAAWAVSRRLTSLVRVSRSRGGRRESRVLMSASNRAAAWGTIAVTATPEPLADVEQIWPRPEIPGQRTVLVP